ncbi:hypothetical protein KRX51_02095 [Corynebacterium sp. TAE3-ERU12]|uniref:hypothetical protein n=1 Tax=Corynebacterium sp. TAE3-ERU12 TaxID=2849491 RepID=UPI001C45F6FA|nr:hypothetical protein [Corynebacterium sp. TAE3-ERU12]MBV7294710.1 hypothetical protein [Corynebacterium sp. TAE3-ERU12]
MPDNHRANFDDIMRTYRSQMGLHQRRWEKALAETRRSLTRANNHGQPTPSASTTTTQPTAGAVRRISSG